ncbi:DUF1643 domain-containing protein [Gottfriedia sp. NPDC056225]|uniref:DUF1643 domain-containing protein n=1 Tax=Gottfriedia sp. NPDC056225 TaxID=3345751 RepID=UPI0035D5CED8
MGIEIVEFDRMHGHTVFDGNSECRYSMLRVWNPKKSKATIIMYNPRTLNPNPFILGQSLNRCARGVVEDGDYGAMEVVNLFSKTSNKAKELDEKYRVFDEVNFKYIKEAVESSSLVVLAWGKDGGSPVSRSKKFIKLLSNFDGKLKCFRICDNKQPKYPSGLSADEKLKDCYIDFRGSLHFLD